MKTSKFKDEYKRKFTLEIGRTHFEFSTFTSNYGILLLLLSLLLPSKIIRLMYVSQNYTQKKYILYASQTHMD